MTVKVESENHILATGHAIPVSKREIGVVNSLNIDVKKDESVEVILWTTSGKGYTWEVKDAILTPIQLSNPKSDDLVKEVRHIAKATGDAKGSVSFSNRGQSSSHILRYTVTDSPYAKGGDNLPKEIYINSDESRNLAIDIVIVVAIVAVIVAIGVVIGIAVTKKACFAPKEPPVTP